MHQVQVTKNQKSVLARSAGTVFFCLASLLLTSTCAAQDLVIESSALSSPKVATTSEGVSSDGKTNYYSFNGLNGLKLPLSMPATGEFDYTMMFWFRSTQSIEELVHDSGKAYLFDFPGCCSCYIEDGVTFKCNVMHGDSSVANPYEFPINALPDIQSWMHLTFSAEWGNTQVDVDAGTAAITQGTSYLRLDFPTQHATWRGSYASLQSDELFLGIGSDLQLGFIGDIREVWVSLGYLDDSNVPNIMNMNKVFDVSTMGYYKFQDAYGRLNDAMRDQTAMLILSDLQGDNPVIPMYMQDVNSYPYCDTLPSEFKILPMFHGAGLNPYQIPVKNYTETQNQFGYTMSMWVKNVGGQSFSRSPGIGRNEHHLIELQEAFAIWFDSKTSFRVYVFAKDNEFETYTGSIFLPLNQWTNIQLTLNSTVGITVMTFNSNGERQQMVHKDIFLKPQKPSPNLLLFQNFAGYGYKVEIWEIFMPTPIQPDMLGSENKIIDYDFTKENYVVDSGDVAGLSMTGFISQLDEENGQLMFANEGLGFNFEPTKLPTGVNFTSPASVGQIHAMMTPWNGVACPNAMENQAYLNEMGSNVQIEHFIDPTDRYTVEFWFRIPPGSQTPSMQDVTYLYTMSEGSADTEAMTIYIDASGKLKCAPFGINSYSSNQLTYSGVQPFNVDKWQHVSCSYQQHKFVIGQYVAINLSTSNNVNQDILPITYAQNIASNNDRIQNYIERTKWTITLGNNWDNSKYQDAYFKDLRVWTSVRSVADLYTYRTKQVPISDDLHVNLKLLDGNPMALNFASTSGKTAMSTGVTYVMSDGDNLVCSADMFFDSVEKKCTGFPYRTDIPIVYRVVNSVQHGHQMILSRDFAYSPMALPGSYQPRLSSWWQVNDEEVDAIYLQGRQSLGMLSFDAIYMGDGKEYAFRLKLKDDKNHHFYNDITQTIYPRKCSLVVDSATESSVNSWSKTISTNTADNLEFEFFVEKIEGCEDEYANTLQSYVDIQTQPPISPEFLENAQRSFTRSSGAFKISFQGDSIVDGMPMNIPVNFIFSVFWKPNSRIGSDYGDAYMSIVYTVTYSQAINANVTASAMEVDIDASLVLDARRSKFENYETLGLRPLAGIVYKWRCPEPFTEYCDSWYNSPILEITPEAFVASGGQMLNKYDFVVETWSIEAGMMPVEVFSSSQKVQWKTLQSPEFKLMIAEADNKMYVTRTSEVLIDLTNYRSTYEFLTYDFTLTPPETGDVSLIRWSQDMSTLLFDPNALQFGTQYSLEVTISNTENSMDGTTTDTLTFTTEQAPSKGSITVSPSTGIMFETEFTITLAGFSSTNQPQTYAIYGITSFDPYDKIRLSTSDVELEANGGASETKKLPLLLGVQAIVTDTYGEIVEATQLVTISSGGAASDWTSVANTIMTEQQRNTQLKWQYYAFVANQANLDAMDGSTTLEDAHNVNLVIAMEARNDVIGISSADMDDETLDTMRGITQTLIFISKGTYNSAAVMQPASDALEYIQTKENSFDILIDEEIFAKDFLEALGNMMQFTSTKADQLNLIDMTPIDDLTSQLGLRNLQEDDMAEEDGVVEVSELNQLRSLMRKFIVIKNKQLDLLCDKLMQYESQMKVSAPKMTLIVAKIQTSTTSNPNIHFVETLSGTTSVIPTNELIRQTMDLDASVTEICIQQSFMTVNPVGGYIFDSQEPAITMFSQTDSVDSEGNRLLSDGFNYLELNEFELAFDYDYPEGEFLRNQTVCMSFNGNSANFINDRWMKESCQTVYDEENMSTLICKCSALKNHYVAVITDQSRDLEVIVVYKFKFHSVLLWVIIPLMLFGCCCPLYVAKKDIWNFEEVETDKFDHISDQTIKALKIGRGGVYKFKEEIYYKLSNIDEYQELTEFRSGTWSSFWIFTRHLHPLISVFSQFDFAYKRMIRFSIILAQLCLITLLCWGAYSKKLEEMAEENGWGDFRKVRDHKVFYVSLLLGLLTFPVPKWTIGCFRTKMYEKAASPESTNNLKDNAKKNTDEWHKSNLGGDTEGDIITTGDGTESNMALIDEYMQLKIVFVMSLFVFWLFTVFISILFVVLGAQAAGDDANRQMFVMSEIDAEDFVKTWYFAIFVWGYGVFNILRIYIISMLAPNQANYELEQEKAPGGAEQLNKCCGWGRCSLTQVLFIPRESVEITLDVLTVIDIVRDGGGLGAMKGHRDDDFDDIADSEQKGGKHVNAVPTLQNNKYDTNQRLQQYKPDIGIEDMSDEESPRDQEAFGGALPKGLRKGTSLVKGRQGGTIQLDEPQVNPAFEIEDVPDGFGDKQEKKKKDKKDKKKKHHKKDKKKHKSHHKDEDE